jgi:hypothetical protein
MTSLLLVTVISFPIAHFFELWNATIWAPANHRLDQWSLAPTDTIDREISIAVSDRTNLFSINDFPQQRSASARPRKLLCCPRVSGGVAVLSLTYHSPITIVAVT